MAWGRDKRASKGPAAGKGKRQRVEAPRWAAGAGHSAEAAATRSGGDLQAAAAAAGDRRPPAATGGAQRRQEVPTSLADPLGSHAARAGSQRQQALARAATLLNMRPRQASAPRWQQGAVAAGDTPAAAAAPRGAPSRSVQSQHAPAPAAARMSGQAASSRGQQAAQECHEQQAPPPAGPADPAASTHSSAGDAEVAAVPMPGKRRDAQQQQQPDIVQRRPSPPGYFVDARTRLQQLAAGTGGGRPAELAMTPMLQQKLERHSGGLPGYSGLLPPPSQRRVLAPANADQRKSTTSTGLQLQCSDLPPSPLLGLSLGDRRLAGGLLVQHSLLAGSGSGLGGRGHSSSEGDEWRRGLSAAAGHGLDGWACSEDEDGGAVAFSDGLASPALQPQPWEQQGFQGQPLGSAAAGATAGGPWLPSEDDAAIERLFEGPSSRSRGEAGGRLQGLLQPGEAQRSPAGPQWQQQQLFGEQEPGSGWWDEEPGAGGAAAAAQDSLAGWLPASPGFAEAAAQQRGQQALLDSLVQGDAALLPPLQRMQQAPQLRLGLARQQGGGALNFLAPSPQRHF